MRCNMVMARKQVIVQHNDELLAGLDRAAESSGSNRSRLIGTAIAEYLERSLGDDIDRQDVEAYTRMPADDEFDAAALSRLARSRRISRSEPRRHLVGRRSGRASTAVPHPHSSARDSEAPD